MSNRILHVDSSARMSGSLTRETTAFLAKQLVSETGQELIYRDLNKTSLPLITEKHIEAYYTPADTRNDEQKHLLEKSDELIAELKLADTLIIGAPMYNFSVPAALKSWIDLVCRVGETFAYTETGPQGLLNIDKAFIIVATGGVPLGSSVDFSSAYLQQVCRFIGVKESYVIDLAGSKQSSQSLIEKGKKNINELLNNFLAA